LGYLRWLEGRTDDARLIYAQMAGLEKRLPLLDVQQKMLGGLLAISAKRYAAAEASLLEAVRLQAKEWISEIYGSARLLLGYCYYCWERPREALAQIEVTLASCEKNHTSGTILQAMPVAAPLLRLAVKGGTDARLAKDLLDRMGLSAEDPDGKTTLLTERQLDILRLMAAGYSNQAIADELVLTLATVKSHAVHILNRLGASSRMEAVAKARKLGLL
jgi:LuxR family maltose regulon positive regulatory protein